MTFRRAVSPLGRAANRRSPEIDRFWAKIELEGSCWRWKAGTNGNNYGVFGPMLAHRWSYEHFIGPIPKGLIIDHLCRNTRCVKPWHLEPVTYSENGLRGLRSALKPPRTHCRNGHLLAEKGTVTNGTCRACVNRNNREYQRRLRLEGASQ